MGLWGYGTVSIVFDRQVIDNIDLINDMVCRVLSKQVILSTTLSTTKGFVNSDYDNKQLSLKKGSDFEPSKYIKSLHFTISGEDLDNLENLEKEFTQVYEYFNSRSHNEFKVKYMSYFFYNSLDNQIQNVRRED